MNLYNVELTTRDISVILKALSECKLGEVLTTYMTINNQVMDQSKNTDEDDNKTEASDNGV